MLAKSLIGFMSAAVALLFTPAAGAATYVQYSARFSGTYQYLDYPTGTSKRAEGVVDVVWSVPTPVTASTPAYSSGASFGSTAQGSLYGSFGINWNAASSLSFSASQPLRSFTTTLLLGTATNGALTDFSSASGSLVYNDTTPSAGATGSFAITSFRTSFSDTPFVSPTMPLFSLAMTSYPLPEPATWMLMLGGFGLVGSAIRRVRPTAGIPAHS